jgi:hypothetical protein
MAHHRRSSSCSPSARIVSWISAALGRLWDSIYFVWRRETPSSFEAGLKEAPSPGWSTPWSPEGLVHLNAWIKARTGKGFLVSASTPRRC